MTRFIAFATTHDGLRLPVLPRTKKRTTFATKPAAERALDRFGRKLGMNAKQGLLYAAPVNPDDVPIFTMAI